MHLEQALQTLSNHEAFAKFIFTIRDLREEAISELHKADFDNIQQISGRILTYDQILQMSDYNSIQRRFG
tara:strand:- start:5855 stop:6064 length:210 start_codon:yes stop_codon:yes gene_type:complete